MKESEYIAATNLAKINVVVNTLRDVMHGDDYGVNKEDYFLAFTNIIKIQSKLFKLASIDPE